jgi:hypothetical protein
MRLLVTTDDSARQLINARNEGVPGSSPGVGFVESPANWHRGIDPGSTADQQGNPVYVFNHQQVTSLDCPDELKRGSDA